MIRKSITKSSPILVSAAICMLIAIQAVIGQIPGDPNGTRPVVLFNPRVAPLNANQDLVSGNLRLASTGAGVGGKQVEVYAVGASFLRIGVGRTGADGSFGVVVSKLTAGSRNAQIQIVIPNGGSHSRPYPTLTQTPR